MPVLPLMDLMLLAGWTSLAVGFVLKVVYLLTHYRPTLLSLTPIDFLTMAIAAFLFAIALAARTWVASQAPARSAVRRACCRCRTRPAQPEKVRKSSEERLG